MAYGLSTGHMTDDVTWPRKVKLVARICLGRNFSKTTMSYSYRNSNYDNDTSLNRKEYLFTEMNGAWQSGRGSSMVLYCFCKKNVR